jgi:hypothetical protein
VRSGSTKKGEDLLALSENDSNYKRIMFSDIDFSPPFAKQKKKKNMRNQKKYI